MAEDIKYLKSDIQKVLACNFNENGAMTADFALSLISAFVLGITGGSAVTSYDALNEVMKYTCPSRKKLKELDFNGCVRSIYEGLKQKPAEELKDRLMSLDLKLILDIGESGHLSFSKLLASYATSTIRGGSADRFIVNDITDNCGPEQAEGTEPDVNGAAETAKPTIKEPAEEKNPTNCCVNSKKDLEFIPEVIALKKHFNTIKKEGKRYFWEWRVSTEEYDDLKKLLKSVRFKDRPTESIKICAPQIALYLAEWYKREYDGDNTVKSMEDIDLGAHSRKTQIIWENAGLRDEDLFCSDETNVHMWLYSMYILGGFPIKYANTDKARRLSSLFDALWGEDKEADTISDEQMSDISQGFYNSQVIKKSLVSGSLHDYYRYLRLAEDMPVCETDKSRDPFKTFINNLKEGRNKFFRNYIRANWYLYTAPGDSSVDSTFRVTFGRKNDKCYIPAECLEYWKIPQDKDIMNFRIEIKETGSGRCESIRFSKSGAGDRPYVGWTRKNSIDLDIPYSPDARVEVNFRTDDKCYPICDTYTVEGSHQFYKTQNPYEWSDRTDNHALTAVIYDPLVYSSDKPDVTSSEKSAGGKEWIWMPLTEETVLMDGMGNKVSYTPHNHLLTVSFKLIRNTLKYINFRDVLYRQINDGEVMESHVPLMKKEGMSVSFTPFGSSEQEKIPVNRYEVYFKQEGDNSFIHWDKNHEPSQGIVRLNVFYRERNISSTVTVFYLPSRDPVMRDLINSNIRFDKNIKDIHVPTKDGGVRAMREEEGNIFHDRMSGSYDSQSDIVPFIIGRPESSHAVINVYRARKCKELYLEGDSKPLITYSRNKEHVEIPFIIRNSFRIRIIDEEGVRSTRCGENLHMRKNETKHIDRENRIEFYKFRGHGTDKRGEIQLETNADQYRFYFWSTKEGDQPVAIGTHYDEDTKMLSLDLSLLQKDERGVVFQSLRGLTPRHYFAPIYGTCHKSGNYSRRQECFDVAAHHMIPFDIFNCFRAMFDVNSSDNLLRFLKDLLVRKDWNLSYEDYRSLHRFANEFGFDWILIPRRLMFRVMLAKDDKKSQESLNGLFRSAPYIRAREKEYVERVLDLYWRLPNYASWGFRRSTSPSNLAMQCIRGDKKDMSIIGESSDEQGRMKILEDIQGYDRLFEETYRTFAIMIKK